jgi:hypothetical protein
VGGWTKTRPVSLGLLPSGPDPVGERYVLRQPPAAYVDHDAAGRKGRSDASTNRPLLCDHHSGDLDRLLVGGEQHFEREFGERHVVRRAEDGDRAEE